MNSRSEVLTGWALAISAVALMGAVVWTTQREVNECRAVGEREHVRFEYLMFAGCQIQVDGVWTPLNVWKQRGGERLMPTQYSLQLGPAEIPECRMRAAWERCRMPQSFDQAMQVPHLRIGLTHVALTMTKGGSHDGNNRGARRNPAGRRGQHGA